MTSPKTKKTSLNVCVWNALSKLAFRIKQKKDTFLLDYFYFQITQLNVSFSSGYSTLKKKEISTLQQNSSITNNCRSGFVKPVIEAVGQTQQLYIWWKVGDPSNATAKFTVFLFGRQITSLPNPQIQSKLLKQEQKYQQVLVVGCSLLLTVKYYNNVSST